MRYRKKYYKFVHKALKLLERTMNKEKRDLCHNNLAF